MEKNCKSRLKMASQGILNITPSGAKSKHLEKWERLVFRILLEFNLVLLFAKFANFKYILDIWSNWEASASADCQDMFSIWKLPKAKPTRCNSLPPHPSTSSPRSPTTSSTSSWKLGHSDSDGGGIRVSELFGCFASQQCIQSGTAWLWNATPHNPNSNPNLLKLSLLRWVLWSILLPRARTVHRVLATALELAVSHQTTCHGVS